MIRPLGKRLILERPEPKVSSGLFVPGTEENREEGIVLSVGPEVQSVKPGDRVLFRKYTPYEIEVEGAKVLLLDEGDVLAVIEPT